MKDPAMFKHIAIIGGGPSALFVLKKLTDSSRSDCILDIFEAGPDTGSGFPYSREGACYEHISNVSGNEIPPLVGSTAEWLKTLPAATLNKYGISLPEFNDDCVFPRLLLGEYLHKQFELLLQRAIEKNMVVHVHVNSRVTDIIHREKKEKVTLQVSNKTYEGFDHVIICTGHQWPVTCEGIQPGFYDSPYPPAKIARTFNHAIAIKGSSLTAIDAIRTLALQNGRFTRHNNNQLVYTVNEKSNKFCIAMYSLHGLLPAVRFHLEESHLPADSVLPEQAISHHREQNDGFLLLDFIFEKYFKEPLRKKDPVFYDHIRHMTMESFVDEMMNLRERAEPFQLLRAEYEEARLSIKRKRPVYWKEMLTVLSFSMNFPAKYFSAEDMQRLQKTLMPLISIIIALMPQDSCEELFALHNAGKLSIIPVAKDSHYELHPGQGVIYYHTDEAGKSHATVYNTFIDCTGQRQLWIKDFPFASLVKDGRVSQALLRFRSTETAIDYQKENAAAVIEENGRYYLKVPGLAITDCFNVVGTDNQQNPRIYLMAVPFMGGFNPDYSGLDFCEAAAQKIVQDIFKQT